jgi:hypothetical protein
MPLTSIIQKTLFTSFIPIAGNYFKMENSVLFLVVYQETWTTTCVAGTFIGGEGALIFHSQNLIAKTKQCS